MRGSGCRLTSYLGLRRFRNLLFGRWTGSDDAARREFAIAMRRPPPASDIVWSGPAMAAAEYELRLT